MKFKIRPVTNNMIGSDLHADKPYEYQIKVRCKWFNIVCCESCGCVCATRMHVTDLNHHPMLICCDKPRYIYNDGHKGIPRPIRKFLQKYFEVDL